jgi:putative sigma-54 modulation protein
MEIDISGRHFRATEPLKEYIDAKVRKLDKYSLKIESVHVVLEVQKFVHLVEITLLGKNLRVTAKMDSTDMYAAFDRCFGVIQLQLGRQHDRVKEHKARRYSMKTGDLLVDGQEKE